MNDEDRTRLLLDALDERILVIGGPYGTYVHGRGLVAADYLARNDSYHWFEPLGGLIKTGPTHTNVCDLRVVLVDRVATAK